MLLRDKTKMADDDWARINISHENLAYLKRSARKHDRTPPKELEVILREAGVIPEKDDEEEEEAIPAK